MKTTVLFMRACKPEGQRFLHRSKTKLRTEIVEKQNGTCKKLKTVKLNNFKIYL